MRLVSVAVVGVLIACSNAASAQDAPPTLWEMGESCLLRFSPMADRELPEAASARSGSFLVSRRNPGSSLQTDDPPAGRTLPGPADPERPIARQLALRGVYLGADKRSGNAVALDIDFGFRKGISLTAMIAHFRYHWEDDEKEEDGFGTGIGIDFRWYVSRQAYNGFYIGTGLSVLFIAHWEYDETYPPTFAENDEEGDDLAGEAHIVFGYAIRLGDRVRITPSGSVGYYYVNSESDGFPYGGLGLSLSIGF